MKVTRGNYTHTSIAIEKIAKMWRAQFEAWQTKDPTLKADFTIWARSEDELITKINNFFNDKD